MMKATGKTILLRLSIHCAISCGVIVVKLCNCARVGLRVVKDFGGGVLSIVMILPTEHSWSLSSSIFTEAFALSSDDQERDLSSPLVFFWNCFLASLGVSVDFSMYLLFTFFNGTFFLRE